MSRIKKHQKKLTREAKQKLAELRVQVLMLEEIKMQLVVFHKFAIAKHEEYKAGYEATGKEDLAKLAEKLEVSMLVAAFATGFGKGNFITEICPEKVKSVYAT